MARALAAAVVVSLLAVSAAGGTGAQTPTRGGTVVIASGEPICLNLFVWTTCQPSGFTVDLILNQVLEGAFEVAPSLSYRPNLVSGVSVAKDPFTVTYRIRQQARWSDGTPVTAADFVFTAKTAVSPGVEYVLAEYYKAIRRVVAVDSKTVRVVFRSPLSAWRELFSVVLPRHALEGADMANVWRDTIDDPRTGRPIGSGPFLVERFERGKQITLVRNPRYWGKHPAYLDRIVFRLVPGDQASQVKALSSGEVDVIYPQVQDPPELAALTRVAGIEVDSAPVLRFEHFSMRLRPKGHPALANPLVRRALGYGLDRVALVRELFRSINPSLRPLDSLAFMTNSPHYRPNWSSYRHRPARARELLEAAGCRRGPDGIYSCAGERLSLRTVTTAGNLLRERTVQIAQRQLRAVGIEVVPVFAPPNVIFGTIVPEGAFDLVLFTYFAGAQFGANADVFRCGDVLNNPMGYCNSRVSRDLRLGEVIVDPKRRAAVLNRADEQLVRDIPMLPLYQRPSFLAYRSKIRSVVENPSFELFTWNSENWWLAR